VQKALRPALFLGLLLLAAYLRITGLSWGLSSGYGHDLNFQPDEFVSLRGVRQVDLLAGRIKASDAYFEGTFNYYLWAIPQALLKVSNKKGIRLADSMNATDPSDLLYICRWMSVLFDLCTICVVFLAIKEATQKFYPSLVGALCYTVIPMQVIYAHFMRTHILSNLLCSLVIWLSLKLRRSRRPQLLVGVGLISGLGAATRFPVVMIVAIPCLYLLFNDANNLAGSKAGLLQRVKTFATVQGWLIALGFGIGLFVGHPMLFFDPSSVIKEITDQVRTYGSLHEFSPDQLFNLGVLWRYITYVIPFAMYPLLWLVPYCAILYLVFSLRLYSLTVPLLIFSLLYLYFMGKGYLGPYFARPAMLLFPGFCILVGIAFSDLHSKLRNKPILAAVLTTALLLLMTPSVAFDVAYDRAMQQKDARQALREDLQNLIDEAPASIGILHYGPYFYTAMPAARPLNSEKVAVRLQDPGQDADFLLVGFPGQIQPPVMNATVRQVEAQGKFKYERSYSVPVTIFGHEFRLERFPMDMTYPFPTILLFRTRTST
jgi:hypothetical protein